MNGPKDTYDRTIDLVDVASGTVTANVTKHTGDGDYAWMPDGRSFVFVRKADKQKPQLYRYTLATGTIVQLTHIKDGVSGPVPSHAGDRIALSVTETDPAPAAHIDFAKAGFTPKESQKKSDINVIDQLFFQTNGAGLYLPRSPAHLDRCTPTARTRNSSRRASTPKTSTPGRPTTGRSSSIRCATNRSTAARATSTRCRPPAARWRKSLRRSPSNGGFFFSNDGQPRLLPERRRHRLGRAAGADFGEPRRLRPAHGRAARTRSAGAIRCSPT